MGRPPIGNRAMSAAERQRRHRLGVTKQSVTKRDVVTKPDPPPVTKLAPVTKPAAPVTKLTADNDWDLFTRAVRPVVRDLSAEGRKNMATMAPASVAVLAHTLKRLVERWPQEPPEMKRKLAAAKSSHAIGALLAEHDQFETEDLDD